MKGLAKYGGDVAYKTMSYDANHALVPVDTHAFTKGFAQGFYDLLDKIRDTSAKEDALALDVARAEGFIVAVDADIDVLVTNIVHRASAALGKNSTLYSFLLGDQTETEIRAPVLDEELATVKGWVKPLQGCSDTILQNYGNDLANKVAEADQRIQDLATAEQLLKEFREIGPRKQLVDDANTLRATVYLAISQLPPSPGLPADFADRVFQYERTRRYRKKLTSKQIETKIADNEKEHADLLQQLADTKAAEADAANKKAKKKAKPVEDALAAAQKKAADLQAEIADLQAQLQPSSTPPASPTPSTPSTPSTTTTPSGP